MNKFQTYIKILLNDQFKNLTKKPIFNFRLNKANQSHIEAVHCFVLIERNRSKC